MQVHLELKRQAAAAATMATTRIAPSLKAMPKNTSQAESVGTIAPLPLDVMLTSLKLVRSVLTAGIIRSRT